MKAPVVVADGSEVTVFQSVAEAERSVAPRDAISGRLRAWDADGRTLRFDIDDALCLDLAHVILSAPPNAPRDPDSLRAILQSLLITKEGGPPNEMSLDELIRRAIGTGRRGE